MNKKTIKIICITTGAIAAVGAGVTILACALRRKRK